MRNRPGKIYGQTGHIMMIVALALLFAGWGLAIGMTEAKCRAVAREIKSLEAERTRLMDSRRDIAEKLAMARDSIFLRSQVEGTLRQAKPDQIVNVPRRYEPIPTSLRTTPRDPRFTALDIAFVGGASAR